MNDRERPWHHLPDGTFRNPPGSPKRLNRPPKMWRFLLRQLGRSIRPRVNIPLGHVIPPAEALADFHVTAPADSITWIGHACFLIRLAGKIILTDPYLTKHASPIRFGPKRFVPPGIPISALPAIDVILLSHNHYDHLDDQGLRKLRHRDRTTVMTPLGNAKFLTDKGFKEVIELDWHESSEIGEITVTALPVIHWSQRNRSDTNKSLWSGFSIKAGQHLPFFFSGDSGYGPVFRELGDRYGPFDLAIVGIGAYEPRAIMQASHANPEEAVQMAVDLQARAVLGMHWGTVLLTEEPPFEPPGRFRAAAASARYAPDDTWIMAIGETRLLPRGWPKN